MTLIDQITHGASSPSKLLKDQIRDERKRMQSAGTKKRLSYAASRRSSAVLGVGGVGGCPGSTVFGGGSGFGRNRDAHCFPALTITISRKEEKYRTARSVIHTRWGGIG
jgi:hypothetical protein